MVFIWLIIERINDFLFAVLYKKKEENLLPRIFEKNKLYPYTFRKLVSTDVEALARLIDDQSKDDLKYFKPHGFDMVSLQKQMKKRSFLMMGAFDDNRLIGYFFLRFFFTRKCFVGRLIDKSYRGKGIGEVMNQIMYNTSWKLSFKCLSTISKNNKAVVAAHKKNPAFVVLKELQNNYLLVEFINTVKK